jgi:hypothetical protein
VWPCLQVNTVANQLHLLLPIHSCTRPNCLYQSIYRASLPLEILFSSYLCAAVHQVGRFILDEHKSFYR